MCRGKAHPHQRGSILLLTLLTTAVLATLALSFAATIKGSIQVTRDHTASLHSDLAAQSGLEYAQQHLREDPEWAGTGASLTLPSGAQLMVERMPGPVSRAIPTVVQLIIEGQVSASTTRLKADVLVTPGDPLLDKAVCVLGGASGSNLQIVGDYLLIDAAGHLWDFHEELVDGVQQDSRLRFSNRGKGSNQELAFVDADIQKLKQLVSNKAMRMIATVDGLTKAEVLNALDAWRLKGGGLAHLRGKDRSVAGVWLPSPETTAPSVSLSRIDAAGDLYHYAPTTYGWASGQELEKDPVHAPGWKLGSYLQADPNTQVFDHVTLVDGQNLEKTAVFILDPGQTLTLRNVQLKGGMVVYAEADYDSAGPPRNQLILDGKCLIGGGNGGKPGIGILAPGCRLTTAGTERQQVFGFSILHSLDTVQRLVHHGVLIILNSAVGVIDSSFTYDRSVALNPPLGLSFFGELPGVDIQLLQESYDLVPTP